MKTYKIITILLAVFLMLGSNMSAQNNTGYARKTSQPKDPKEESYKQSIKQQNQEINRLRKELEGQQKKLNNYYLDLIEIGSNFLYLPYNAAAIRDIAKPALEAARPYDKFDKYKIRLDCIVNYNNDITDVKNFINEHPINQDANLTVELAHFNAAFLGMEAVKRYLNFGEGWEDTYLGKYINEIMNLVTMTNQKATADSIQNKLNGIAAKLASNI